MEGIIFRGLILKFILRLILRIILSLILKGLILRTFIYLEGLYWDLYRRWLIFKEVFCLSNLKQHSSRSLRRTQ